MCFIGSKVSRMSDENKVIPSAGSVVGIGGPPIVPDIQMSEHVKPLQAPQKNTENPDMTSAQSLEKLLAHIESLKKSNHEMNSVLNAIAEGNKEKLKSMISTKIEPWIKALGIPEEHQIAFLKGIENACHTGQIKGIADFENNPVYTVACAAAAAHGNAIRQVEESRAQLAELASATEDKENRVKNARNNILFDDANNTVSALGKRGASMISGDEETVQSKCWDTMFETMSTH